MTLACVAEIVRGLGDWAAEELQIKFSHEQYAKLSLHERREQSATALELGIPIMQPEARFEMVDSLRALNANQRPPIFSSVVSRNGDAPDLTARAQLALLMWVRWQCGQGCVDEHARRRAADAAACSPKTLAYWEEVALELVYGKETLHLKLELAAEIGRLEAEGKTLRDLRPHESDHDQLLWETWNFERDLKALGDRVREARGKRTVR
jgi:hypothetical protein